MGGVDTMKGWMEGVNRVGVVGWGISYAYYI